MRQELEYFDDKEPVLVHIAGTLRGALKLERLLTEYGMEYYIETDRYVSGFLFASERTGAFFYVAEPRADEARAILRRHRFQVQEERPGR